jgi:hypothetical protein
MGNLKGAFHFPGSPAGRFPAIGKGAAAQGNANSAHIALPGVILKIRKIFTVHIDLAVLIDAQVVVVVDLAIVTGSPMQINVTDTAPHGPGHAPQCIFVNYNRVLYDHVYHAPFHFSYLPPHYNKQMTPQKNKYFFQKIFFYFQRKAKPTLFVFNR